MLFGHSSPRKRMCRGRIALAAPHVFRSLCVGRERAGGSRPRPWPLSPVGARSRVVRRTLGPRPGYPDDRLSRSFRPFACCSTPGRWRSPVALTSHHLASHTATWMRCPNMPWCGARWLASVCVTVAFAPGAPSPTREPNKRCPSCGKDKALDEFPPNRARSDGRQASCRPCYAMYQRQYYRRRISTDLEYLRRKQAQRRKRRREILSRNRGRIRNYLSNRACVDCGERDRAVLEFDHIDPSRKSFSISDAVFRRSWPEIERELAKCEVRCANCHRRRTAEQFGYGTARDSGA